MLRMSCASSWLCVCVIGAVHREDHRARAEEQQRLEEGVRHEVEDARRVRAHADADEHVAELRHRRIREHLLDVPLLEADRRREQRGQRADERDRQLRDRREREQDALRAMRYTPAVTIVAAWISADTGVGPAIASGSQT